MNLAEAVTKIRTAMNRDSVGSGGCYRARPGCIGGQSHPVGGLAGVTGSIVGDRAQ